MRKLNSKEADYAKLEEEHTMLKSDLEKTILKSNTNLKFEKSSEILTNIIDSQKPSSSKTGVGYERSSKNHDCTFKGFIKEGRSMEDLSTKEEELERYVQVSINPIGIIDRKKHQKTSTPSKNKDRITFTSKL